MQLNIVVKSQGKITLTDKEYIGAGGEAAVYKKADTAFKIYHDPKKMIPIGKIRELQNLTPNNVLRPLEIIQQANADVGYTMTFVSDTHPICQLFTKTFRDRHALKPQKISDLVKIIQTTLGQIHKEDCLVVDLNEMNLLASQSFDTVYFIDVDSYQTNSYKATAIMDSIRDRLVKNNQFTEMSDWFSFAVIAFQMYVGIHPYKGRHPDYKPNEWAKRMEDGISVFDKSVTLPPTCYDFSLIPKGHLNWFQEIFVKNDRSVPPLPDQVLVVVPVQKIKVITSTGDFDVKLVMELQETILWTYYHGGCEFGVGERNIYCDKKIWNSGIDGWDKIGLLDSGSELFPAICLLKKGKLKFRDPKGETIGVLDCKDFMMRNGCIYAISAGRLVECSVAKSGEKYILHTRIGCLTSELSTKAYDGVVFQDLLGKIYITLPFLKGSVAFRPLKELDKYRILDAKSESNICIVMAEKGTKYYRFIITFDNTFSTYKVRVDDDVLYSEVNFTVKPNGVCILVTEDGCEIFKDNQIKKITNSPFSMDNQLFNRNGDIFFIDDEKIYSVKAK